MLPLPKVASECSQRSPKKNESLLAIGVLCGVATTTDAELPTAAVLGTNLPSRETWRNPLKHSDSQWSIVKHSEALKKTPLLKTMDISHDWFSRFSWKHFAHILLYMRQVYQSGRSGFLWSACRNGLKRWVLNPSAAASDDYVNKWKRGNPSLLGLGEKCGRSCSKVSKVVFRIRTLNDQKKGICLTLGKLLSLYSA